MRFFIGDVRDKERLYRAFDGVDYIIHAAQNVIDAGSRGSVIPFLKSLIEQGCTQLPITDFNMTRFWISLKEPVEFLNYMIENILNKNTRNKMIDMENKTGGGLCSRLEDIIQ